jgi:hypothetical protein
MEKLLMAEMINIISSLFHRIGRDDIVIKYRVIKILKEILPENINLKIEVKGFTNGKLRLKSSHSLWASEIRTNKSAIIKTLNEKLGREIIKDISIR